jgi:protein SCO1/2
MAYYECPMLCSQVLNRVMQAAQELEWTAGKEFRILTVSFDHRDDVAAAAAKRKVYVEAYTRKLDAPKAWDFLVGDDVTTRKLADTIGFQYRWDAATNQFAHAGAVFIVSPSGTLSNVIPGLALNPRDLRLSMVDASDGKLGSVADKFFLFCFHYDPNGKGYTLAIMKLLRIFAAVTIVVLGGILVRYWRRERHPRRADPKELEQSST